MKRIGLLTCAELPELTDSDRKIIPLLYKKGIDAKPVIWDSNELLTTDFDVLIFRNTWDYFTKADKFFEWLQTLKDNRITTLNPLEIITWNSHKFYLKELEKSGILIIPSVFISSENQLNFYELIPASWNEAVIKPAVSAGSYLTRLFTSQEINEISVEYKEFRKHHDLIIQKFIPEIKTEGEISLVFFNKIYSHALIKKPKKGDFRIQSQFGGLYDTYFPENEMIEICSKIVHHISDDLLYARVDGVISEGAFHLMELELIEPDLYLDFLPDSHQTFADSIVYYLNK